MYVSRINIQLKPIQPYNLVLIVVFPCMLIITQLLFQQNALVFIKSKKYYNLYLLSLYS
jgi:hypothetical protein